MTGFQIAGSLVVHYVYVNSEQGFKDPYSSSLTENIHLIWGYQGCKKSVKTVLQYFWFLFWLICNSQNHVVVFTNDLRTTNLSNSGDSFQNDFCEFAVVLIKWERSLNWMLQLLLFSDMGFNFLGAIHLIN